MPPVPPAARRGRPSRSAARPITGRLRAHLRGRGADERSEDGFILLESIVAISLITLLMGALASFTINSLTATTDMRARQGATQVATSTMGALGAVSASDLLIGRTQSVALAQWDAASSVVKATWLSARANQAFTSISSTTVTVPTTPNVQTLNGVQYSVVTYLERCASTPGATTSTGRSVTCPPTSGGTDADQLRAVVAVSWSGRGCRSSSTTGCTYGTATLVSVTPDPVFDNRANPSSRPKITNPGNQVSTRNAAQNVQLATDPGTGSPLQQTWQVTSGALPTGLSLDPSSGVVSGTAPTDAAATPVTVTVTDVYGRTDTTSFTWAVVAPPTITYPGNQTYVRGQAATGRLPFSCDNVLCTWSATGLPPGASIDPTSGYFSGTLTTAGTYPVTVAVTDSDGISASTSFTTTVTVPPPTIGAVGNLQTAVRTTANVSLAYTCPTAPCTITLTNPVPGLGLSTTAGRTDVNSTSTLTVSAASGTVYIGGTTSRTAVPSGTSKTYALTATITDASNVPASNAGTWTATTPSPLLNLAVGRSATESSQAFFGGPEKAVDGNTDGVYNNGSSSHTDQQSQPWWQVDLGSASTISAVTLFNRTDCCTDRLANGRVFLSNTDMTNRTLAQLDADSTVTKVSFGSLTGPSISLDMGDVRARFVRVQLTSTSSVYLTLAEVQVFSPNLAAGRAATQSSTFSSSTVAARAVDSNTDGNAFNGSISQTQSGSQSWWQVDLGAATPVNTVTLWNRTECCGERLNNAVLMLSATDMTGRTYAQLNADAAVTKIAVGTPGARVALAAGGVTARYVRVQQPGTSGTEIDLAEVHVTGVVP